MIEQILYTDALPYLAVFLASFAMLFFILNRTAFGSNRAVSTVIAGSVSFLILWGLGNYTDYLDEIGSYFGDFTQSVQLIIFLAVLALILFLLWTGFRESLKKRDFPLFLIGLSLLLILIGFLPNIISRYYLPDWLLAGEINSLEESLGLIFTVPGILFIIAGICLVIYSLKKSAKKTEEIVIRRS